MATEAQRKLALKRGAALQEQLASWLAMLASNATPASTALAAAGVERLWLAMLESELPKAATQKAIIGAVTFARRPARAAAGRDMAVHIRVAREVIEAKCPHALDGVSAAAFRAAFTGRDAKSAIRALLEAAGVPASKATIDKYARR